MEAFKLNHSPSDDRTTSQRVKDTHTEEIIIGICSQIGAEKNAIIDEIEIELKEYGYEVVQIKLSALITTQSELYDLIPGKTEKYSELKSKIVNGNQLRRNMGADYLANIAITSIADSKIKHFNIKDDSDFLNVSTQRKCYIIDSIKHTAELNTLIDVYKDIFYLMSIYTPETERLENMSNSGLSKKEAKELIDTDQHEDDYCGQQVREVFVNADFFLRIDLNTKKKTKEKISRYIGLIFGIGISTPTKEERAMYEAKSAAVNSACLSRQVGASILSKDGELLSTGWNDVPKFGGNLYTSDTDEDNRCYITGKCHNDFNKASIIKHIINDIENSLDVEELFGLENNIKTLQIKNQLSIFIRSKLEKSSIKNLIEFSRSVHAEMHAIINAGHINGQKIKGGVLFCTTYPCHNCARHIIAAGIEKVYYIEPYVKSKAPELHNDSITDNEEQEGKVKLLVFDGVSPKRYLSFFNQNRDRKKGGKFINRSKEKSKLSPINTISLHALLYLESQAAKRITHKTEDYGETEQ